MKEELFNTLQAGDVVLYKDNHFAISLQGAPAVFIGMTALLGDNYCEGRFKGLRYISSYPRGMTSPPSCLQDAIYRDGRKIVS